MVTTLLICEYNFYHVIIYTRFTSAVSYLVFISVHDIIRTVIFLHLSICVYPHFFFFSLCFGCVGHFLLSHDPAAAKLQLLVAEGEASSHSRLQRCMRRGRGLQQRMQLQQRQQQQQEEEGQQLQEQPRYLLSQSEWKRLFGLAIK